MPTENRSSNTENASQHPQGRRERFQKWVLSTKHPVLGYLDGHWLARGDDREGYASEYVQGLWVAYKEFGQPAEQHQDEPVGYVRPSNLRNLRLVAYCAAIEMTGVPRREGDVPLYTHADPAEVERLRKQAQTNVRWQAVANEQMGVINTLRAQLAEAQAVLRECQPCLEKAGYGTWQIDELLSASAEPSSPAVSNLPELTDDLREILGRPNFTCHFIAKALRIMGHNIARKSEDEQAVVIHWLIGHYLKNGADWRQRAEAELKAASEKLQA